MKMEKENYYSYLNTVQWKRKAQARMILDKYRCQMCKCEGTTENPLQVHHLSYRNIGNEDVGKDLVTLCNSCHVLVHRMMNRITDPATGRRGWQNMPSITKQVQVSTYNGIDKEYREITEEYY